MKYCPECEAEYRDEIGECADCQIPLVSAEAYQDSKQQEQEERDRLTRETFVPVKVAENAFEADRIRAGHMLAAWTCGLQIVDVHPGYFGVQSG